MRRNEPTVSPAVRDAAGAHAAGDGRVRDDGAGPPCRDQHRRCVDRARRRCDGLHAVTRYKPQSDKVTRLHAQTATVENGFVHLPPSAPWLAEYLHELCVFPNGRHDDQVDATAQFPDWFKSAGREDGVFAGTA
jgi:predicted phage terminase large subunit-like protein